MLQRTLRPSFTLLLSCVTFAAPQGDDVSSFQGPRVATFNAFLNRATDGELVADLSSPDDAQAAAVAEILQRVRPDIVLLNEFDYDASGTAVGLFQTNYLGLSQHGAEPIAYPYVFLAPSNTGIHSGFDLDNDGQIVTTPGSAAYANDCFGFGLFPGQYGMVVLSRYPILHDQARTFQGFVWADMPAALLPDDPATPEPADWYSDEELEVVRVSSKSHWDVPVDVRGTVLHVLCAHPTPPVFDGPEDRNGLRNHDEIRVWADYVTPGRGDYLVDDAGQAGGLPAGARFVVLGDYNADPVDGDGVPGAIQQLLSSPLVTDPHAASHGGLAAALRQAGANLGHAGSPTLDTGDFTDVSDFFDPSGNLRTDYVLPSRNLRVRGASVFWPSEGEDFYELVGPSDPQNGNAVVSSDHRLVYVDLAFSKAKSAPRVGLDDLAHLEFLGQAVLPTGLVFQDTEVGGLSAIVRDPGTGLYLCLSDDRGSIDDPRAYALSIDLADGALTSDDVTFLERMTLLRPDGLPFDPNVLDPEGLALALDGRMFLSSEGDANNAIDPFVDRFGVVGLQGASLPVPPKFLTGTPDYGIRNNLAFESLSLTPDQRFLFSATENALFQDGPAATISDRSPCRILKYNLSTGQLPQEFVYWSERVAAIPEPPDSFATNGLVELVALDEFTLLAVERSFSNGIGNAIRLFGVSLEKAEDVRGIDSLAGVVETVRPATKTLLLDLASLGVTLDNIEGATFGPVLPDGRHTLVLCSDNNFSAGQFTQFLAFAFTVQD